ncbi:KGG domain-containing protein, partial [Pseudomonas aeruginosa]|uniref:KGG domain-containing protein n=1 Tax=Pseudomonas aeruginosa TaxID=287 RepID=UPI0031B7AD56
MTDKRQGMSTSEAGQKGGAATSRSHGKEFYQEIGHKGGPPRRLFPGADRQGIPA